MKTLVFMITWRKNRIKFLIKKEIKEQISYQKEIWNLVDEIKMLEII
jgi:hypothetical protein